MRAGVLVGADAHEALEECDDGTVRLAVLHVQPGAAAVEAGDEQVALEKERGELLEHLGGETLTLTLTLTLALTLTRRSAPR